MWTDEKINFVWHGYTPANLEFIEQEVVTDILTCLWDLLNPTDLIFHTVYLSEDLDGEHVVVWGKPNDYKQFHCQWHESTK